MLKQEQERFSAVRAGAQSPTTSLGRGRAGGKVGTATPAGRSSAGRAAPDFILTLSGSAKAWGIVRMILTSATGYLTFASNAADFQRSATCPMNPIFGLPAFRLPSLDPHHPDLRHARRLDLLSPPWAADLEPEGLPQSLRTATTPATTRRPPVLESVSYVRSYSRAPAKHAISSLLCKRTNMNFGSPHCLPARSRSVRVTSQLGLHLPRGGRLRWRWRRRFRRC